MTDTDGVASDNLDRVVSLQKGLIDTASLLAECVDALDYFGKPVGDSRVALLDLENDIDAALLKLNGDFAATIEAQWDVSAAERVVQTVQRQVNARKLAAKGAGNDLDAICALYDTPLDPIDLGEGGGALPDNPRALASAVAMDQYRPFCRTVFSAHDREAKAPTNMEAASLALFTLQKRHQLDAEDEDGLQVGESVMRPLCPISSKIFEEPVRASCGHYFSNAAVLDAIERMPSKSILCPSTGCSNSITKDQLFRDRLMDIQVQQYVRTQEKESYLESLTVGRVAQGL